MVPVPSVFGPGRGQVKAACEHRLNAVALGGAHKEEAT